MKSPNFIDTIRIGQAGREPMVLNIARPMHASDVNCITVLCGKNNSGKSHVLREITRAFDNRRLDAGERTHENIHALLVRPSEPPPNALRLDDLTYLKGRFQLLPVS